MFGVCWFFEYFRNKHASAEADGRKKSNGSFEGALLPIDGRDEFIGCV